MQKIILDLNKLRKRLNENKLVNVDFKEYFGNNYNHRKQKIKIHDKITLLTDRLLEEVVYDTKVYFKNDELPPLIPLVPLIRQSVSYNPRTFVSRKKIKSRVC